MKKRGKRFFYFEILLYVLILLISLIIPVVMHYDEEKEWSFICREWVQLIPFVVVFAFNNFLLAPKLLLTRKYPAYIFSCVGVVLLVLFLNNLWLSPKFPPFHEQKRMEMRGREQMPPPQEFRENPGEAPRPPKMTADWNEHKPPRPFTFEIGHFIFCILLIGFNSGIKIFVRWAEEQDERDEKERYYLSTELAFLKHQISPHFFMNTLNNIHALIDIDPERGKDAIIKLSKLMRYLLYESDTAEKTPLLKEIEFMESYVELMRLRYDDSKLSVNFAYTGELSSVSVPSLLFLPIIENAFKHGIDSRQKSFIDTSIRLENEKLVFSVKNSKFDKNSSGLDEASGIGLENVRKRLELLYKGNYEFLIKPQEDSFEVSLIIPVA